MIHVAAIKALPATDALITDCMECGFCEPACPSDGLSLTPRQRISVYRNMEQLKTKTSDAALIAELEKAYQYQGIHTCATTGMCALRCPLSINTGAFIKQLKPNNDNAHHLSIAQKNMGVLTAFGRVATKLSHSIGIKRSHALSSKAHHYFSGIPIVPPTMPRAAMKLKKPQYTSHATSVVYCVSCINRTLSEVDQKLSDTAQHTLNLFEKSGIRAIFPPKMAQLCCGQPFDSKKDSINATKAITQLNEALLIASNNGIHPIYMDNAPCALRVLTAQQQGLIDKRLNIHNAAEFLAVYILPKLTLTKKMAQLALHIPCSTHSMQSETALSQLANACTQALYPSNIDCCGFAGDKGFNLPELNKNGLRHLKNAFPKSCQHGVSMSKTCQIGLSSEAGFNFQSIEALLDHCSDV